MRTHFLVATTAGLILLGGLYMIIHGSQLDEAKLKNKEQHIAKANLEQNLLNREAKIAEIETGMVALKQKQDALAALEADRDAAKLKLDNARRQVEDLKIALKNVQQALREKAPGQNLGTLKLKNGAILENATVKQVKADGISFIHSAGIQGIPASNLPDDVLERFGMEAAPAQNSISLAEQAAEEAATLSAVNGAQAISSKTRTLNDMQQSINGLQAQYQNLQARYNAVKQQAVQKWRDHDIARSNGKISSNSALAKQYDAQADALSNEMGALNSQIQRANAAMQLKASEQ